MKIWDWLRSRLRKRNVEITVAEIFRRTPTMPAEKILECMAVDPDTPLLVAILHVLKGIEEIENENVAAIGIPNADRTFYAGGISKIVEAQGVIIDLVKKGNDAKRGIKSDGGPAIASRRQTTDAGLRSRFVRIGEKPQA